jgi:hypothetical protein
VEIPTVNEGQNSYQQQAERNQANGSPFIPFSCFLFVKASLNYRGTTYPVIQKRWKFKLSRRTYGNFPSVSAAWRILRKKS